MTEPVYEVVEQAQTVNHRNVGTPRTQLNMARDPDPTWWSAQRKWSNDGYEVVARLGRTALVAEGTAQIGSSSVHTVSECNGEPCCVVGTKRGSAWLSTDTTLVTAHHVFDEPVSPEDESCNKIAQFAPTFVDDREGLDLCDDDSDCSGDDVCLAADCTPYTGTQLEGTCESPELAATGLGTGSGFGDELCGRYAIEVLALDENPFLANRLFQLGLRDWAETIAGQQVRSSLRLWPFKLLGWPDQDARAADGADVVTLTACENDLGVTPSSGEFTNVIPAMFFNRVLTSEGVAAWEDARPGRNQDLNAEVPTWLSHVNKWPSSDRTSELTRLVSNPGFIVSKEAAGTAECLNEQTCAPGGGSIEMTTYAKCARTTVDVLKGSSGGAVLVPDAREFTIGSMGRNNSFTAVGTLHSGSSPGEMWWGEHCVRNSEWSGSYDDCLPQISLLDAKALDATRQDLNDEAADGVVTPVPGTRLSPPVITDPDPNCLGSNPPAACGPFGPDGGSRVPPTTSETGGAGSSPDYPNPGNTSRWGGEVREHECTFRRPGDDAGYAVGLLGSRTIGSNQQANDGIGRFQVVCAPWTDLAYNLAWRWLYFAGRGMRDGADTGVNGSSWSRGRLWAGLIYFVEARRAVADPLSGTPDELIEYFRPGSMLMCPPNYVLRGFTLRKAESGYVGIESISCTKLSDHDDTDTLFAKSEGAHEGYEWALPYSASAYYSNRVPFSLDQWIGNPDAGGSRADFVCEKGYAIRGISWRDTGTGPLNDVGYTCIDLP